MEEARPVRPEELGQTLALVNKVFRTGVDQDMSTDYPLVFAPGNLDNLRVVSEGGSIFSHAAMARRELREHGCALPVSMICAVATDPERRRRGAASRIMENAVEAMAARGDAFGLLWTGPARDFYRRLGWEVVGSNGWAYQVEPELAGRFEQPLPVRPMRGDTDLEWIMEIHEAQPRRSTRTRAEYRALLGLPKSEVWVAEERGRVEGYLVVARAYNKSGVVEWGGTPGALSSLLARVLPEPAGERMQVFVPLPDNPMTALLTRPGLPDAHPHGDSRRLRPEDGEDSFPGKSAAAALSLAEASPDRRRRPGEPVGPRNGRARGSEVGRDRLGGRRRRGFRTSGRRAGAFSSPGGAAGLRT